jgi:HlyD family secretion protein
LNYESQPKQNRFEIDSKKALFDRQQFLVEDLKRQVDELSVRSPVDGMVANLAAAEKASVAENAPLLTVVDLTAFEVEFQVADVYARDIKAGMEARSRSTATSTRASSRASRRKCARAR